MKPLYFALPILGYKEKENTIEPRLGTDVIQFDRRWGIDRILTECDAAYINAPEEGGIWSNGYVLLYTHNIDRPYAIGNTYHIKSYLIKGIELPPSKRSYLKVAGWIDE